MDMLLTPESARGMKRAYEKVRDYSGYCSGKIDMCLNRCCTYSVPMSFAEFAYMVDFLASNNPDGFVKDIVTRKLVESPGSDLPEPENLDILKHLSLGQNYYCRILGEDGCTAYPARPFRCRIHRYNLNNNVCHASVDVIDIYNREWRAIRKINDSLDIPQELKSKIKLDGGLRSFMREETFDFWAERFLST